MVSRMAPWFATVLSRYQRIAIVGGPKTGKTTLAGSVTDRPTFSTDEFMGIPWGDIPRAVAMKAGSLGPSWVVEGVQVARALRKGLVTDAVIHLNGPAHVSLTPMQAAMAKAVTSVFEEWNAENTRVPVVTMEKP
jgi:adenylate kinase family enzyme